MADELRKELPHLVVLAVLLLVLLVVLTKFQWVHCTAIPQWCDIYCNVVMRSHSRIALVYGDEGLGDPEKLAALIRNIRPDTYLEPFLQSQLSIGLLKDYDLVVLEHVKNVSSRQAEAIFNYADGGGSILWIGDAASEIYLDEYDLLEARSAEQSFNDRLYTDLLARNESMSSAYANKSLENFRKTREYKILRGYLNVTAGFGVLSTILSAKYNKTVEESAGNLSLRTVQREHMIMRGINPVYDLPAHGFADVRVDPARVYLIAVLKHEGAEYPAIFESRYAGKVIFVAVPLEDIGSRTVITNIFDYLVTC